MDALALLKKDHQRRDSFLERKLRVSAPPRLILKARAVSVSGAADQGAFCISSSSSASVTSCTCGGPSGR